MSAPAPKRTYGWKREVKTTESHAEHMYHAFAPVHLPSSVDLRNVCPPVYDQGQLGSCSANAIGGAYEIDQIIQKEASPFVPSRLFIYYNERVIEGSVTEDSGAVLADGIATVKNMGVCPESMWEYDISKFTDKPPETCYSTAVHHKGTSFLRVKQDLISLKQCLVNGRPFVFGFQVYESFESPEVAKTGKQPMPLPNEQCLGGHAVCCVGYDDATSTFIVRNSWSNDWGSGGYFYMPYAYMTDSNLADDMWAIVKVSDS